ncbi:hypothetical protein HOI26_04055 [Candidatus Woesearchaeota archaeon]|nr:hypothetical protein [Candidatus Woesearchaeota archaeon]MBT5740250.1 hypothetical protein [Candidatus Woesearchaeota archaeon]
MLKVIMDTNIYGKLIEEKKFSEIATKIKNDTDFKVYGFGLIRKELRDTPKTSKLGKFSRRNLLLNLYDGITGGKYLKDSLKIHNLAMKCYNSYRKFGGIINWDKTNIDVDFTIVACAMFYKLDILVSDDSKTMLSKQALKSFKHISIKEALRQPAFWKYSDLKTRYNF